MTRKVLIRLFIFLAAAGFVTLTVLLLIYFTPQPPIKEIEKAREALSTATNNKANTYSKELYTEAKDYYDSAMKNWRKENDKFIYFRNFDTVLKFAKLSTKKAEQANENSSLTTGTFKNKLKKKITSLNKLAEDINTYFNRYPLPSDVRSSISKGKLLLKEGEIDYDKGDYIPANRKLNDSEDLLSSAFDKASSDLQNYFKSYSLWRTWTEAAINESKQNQNYAIIVDKLSRKCFVYYKGIKKYEFDVELGRNWVGDKRRMGDKATPEGMYKITNKFSRTKYSNALLLDYPNSEDKEKFNRDKSRGMLPHYAKIGGGIEIHGNGGKGVDWTEGCIALLDAEMDIVYRIASVGTSVTIVGSTKNIQQILRR